MFDEFPKVRRTLPPEYAAIHEKQSKINRLGGSPATNLSRRMEAWMHRQVAADVSCTGVARSTLEIGAGSLNHLIYEPASSPYDIVEPAEYLLALSSPVQRRRMRSFLRDIADIPLSDRYERIISIASLEHICNLPEVIARSGILLSSGGQFRAAIPAEGTVLWHLAQGLTTGLEFRIKYKLDYGVTMQHEHVNTAEEVEDVLHYFFSDVKSKVFGLTRSLCLYQFLRCTHPNLERCNEYLREVSD
jgi:hypothetical protein